MAKPFAKAFYNSKQWKKCREAYIKSVYGLCERCGNTGNIVHHKKYIEERNRNDPEILLGFNNLEYLCQDCHNKEHHRKEETNDNKYSFDARGNIVPEPPVKPSSRVQN